MGKITIVMKKENHVTALHALAPHRGRALMVGMIKQTWAT
jgi:hypothetical protein